MSISAPARRADGDLAARARELVDVFGRTPLARLRHDRLDLAVKLEYCNPYGSVKDRSAYWILRRAIERGDIGPGTTVVESSSGNFARSVASFCRALGIAFVPVIDPNTNVPTERHLRLLCARVEKVTEPDPHGGFLGSRLARVRELRAELPDVYWPDQYANADAVEAHDLLGAELCAQLSRLDYLFVGVGTGGTVAGLSQRVGQVFPDARIVAVDSVGSAVFGGPTRRRHIPGIGSSIVPPLVSRARIDDVVMVPERDAVRGCRELLDRHGVFAGGSTGSVYAAISSYFADGPTSGRPAVAFLCADSGAAYIDTVHAPGWAERVLDAPVTAGQGCGDGRAAPDLVRSHPGQAGARDPARPARPGHVYRGGRVPRPRRRPDGESAVVLPAVPRPAGRPDHRAAGVDRRRRRHRRSQVDSERPRQRRTRAAPRVRRAGAERSRHRLPVRLPGGVDHQRHADGRVRGARRRPAHRRRRPTDPGRVRRHRPDRPVRARLPARHRLGVRRDRRARPRR
ncbi:hypothetical protein GCM10029964_081990 [Kibdelosporangium lantanae]